MSPLIPELQVLIKETLELADVESQDIDPAAPLFGGGLDLDSIDTLELAVAISKKYNVTLKADEEETKQALTSVNTLAAFIEAKGVCSGS